MSIETKMFGTGEFLVKPSGRIDVNSVAEFERAVNEQIQNVKYLTVDLSDVNYISSIGLRAIMSFYKEMHEAKGEMKVTGLNPEVAEIFKTVGFDKFLNII